MECDDLRELLTDRVLAELTAEQRAAVAAHVAACQACRRAYGLDQQSQDLHEAVKALRGESDLTTAVLARLGSGEGDRSSGEPGDDPSLPKQIAGFEILDLLGRGGMGDVFKARQVSMDRLVALKILPARLAEDEQFVARLVREAQSAAKLHHPGIVHAYDTGCADGHYYFAMEYIEGEGLDAVLRREGLLRQERARQLMMQVAGALAAAHGAGILHRDIKPSNLMLGAHGAVRIADFGLATGVQSEGDQAGTAMGTPAYAAPEICAGRAADARADLYSLGATFFHVLSGRPPFQDRDFAHLVVKQVKEPPPALADVAPHVAPRLCALIDRLLRKNPAERPPSARAVLDDLVALGELDRADATLRDAPTLPLSPGQRLLREYEAQQARGGRGAGRRRIVAIAAAAAGVCLIVGLAVALWPRGRRERARVTFESSAVSPQPQVDAREHNAEVLFLRAQRAARLGQWVAAFRHARQLREEYESTKFYAAHSVEIATLRSRAERELQPRTPVPKPAPVAVPVAIGPEPQVVAGEWVSLFDGKTLKGWRVLRDGGFAQAGPVRVEGGRLLLGRGAPRTGIAWTGDVPTDDYEIAVTARREAGSDSFCGLYFPIGESVCTLSVGGYGGRWIGLANVDGRNPTQGGVGRQMTFGAGRWYHIRLRVTKADVQGWVEDERVFAVPRQGHTFTPSLGDVPAKLAVITWETTAGIEDIWMRRAGREPPAQAGEWVSLFDGKTLEGWQVVKQFRVPPKFGDGRGGEVSVADGRIVLAAGRPATGIAWRRRFPRLDYEVEVEAMQTAKPDCFELVFPVGASHCQLAAGGFGGHVVGLSLVDDRWGTENETTRHMRFERDKWYRVRLRVTAPRIEAWIDNAKVIDLPTAGHTFSTASDRRPLHPFGIAVWGTTGTVRSVRMRRLRREPVAGGRWVSLFEPGALAGWQVATEGRFAERGHVRLVDETIVLEPGAPATGIVCRRPFPTAEYEVAFEVRRDEGLNHAHVLFPVGGSHCILNLGGWGGEVVGLSLVDDDWAPGNGTAKNVPFRNGKWYQVRLRVTKEKVETWIDDAQVIDLSRAGRTLAPVNWPPEAMAFCLSNWESRSAFRNIKMRRLGPPPPEPGEWLVLFDGKTLDQWRTIARFPDVPPELGGGAGGRARADDGRLVLEPGKPWSAVAWTGEFPRDNYELALEAMPAAGERDAVGITFPVGRARTTLLVSTQRNAVSLRCDDGARPHWKVRQVWRGLPVKGGQEGPWQPALKEGQWYPVRVRVTPQRVAVWVAGRQPYDVSRAGHRFEAARFHQWPETFALSSEKTGAAFRDIRVRRLVPELPPEPQDQPGEWVSLFDSKTLDGWRVLKRFPTVKPEEGDGTGGRAHVADGRIMLERGRPVSAIAWQGEFPRESYELSIEAMRIKGGCDFCNLAFPVGDSQTTLGVGTWPNRVELRYLDGRPVEVDERRKTVELQNNQWYRVGVRVTPASIRVTLDDETLIDLPRRGLRFYPSIHHAELQPFGVGTWDTEAAYRNIRVRRLGPERPKLPDEPGKWASLFDGKAFKGWRALTNEQYARHGKVGTVDGCFVLGRGDPLTGIEWLGEFPTVDYEVSLEARRDPGSEAYWYVCLPTAGGGVRLDVGEWKGTLLGLSSVDGQGCQHNDTGHKTLVPIGRWFRVRARVTAAKIEAWLDDEQVVDLARAGRRLTMPPSEAGVRSLALGTCYAAASFRNIQVQRLPGKPEPPPEGGAPVKEATVPVSARADWLDTGLYLREGQAYEVAAAGRWGYRPSNTVGPEGRPRHPKFHPPHDGPMAYDLIGRVGRHGRPVPIGSHRRLEPKRSGRLYLRMNDNGVGDNWGSLRVRVQGDLVAAKSAPLLPRFTQTVAQLKVAPQSGWASTGLEVRPGDRFLLAAEGTHAGGPAGQAVGADGLDGERHSMRLGSLIGRIGEHGARFPVGRLCLLEVGEPGTLRLAINAAPRPVFPRGGLLRLFEQRPRPNPGVDPRAKGGGPPEAPAPVEEKALTVTVLATDGFDPKQKRPVEGPHLTPRLLATLRGHRGWIISVDFSPDGALLASGGRDATVRVWNPATGQCLRVLSGHGQTVESVAFSPDGKRLASTGGDRTVRVWDVATGRPVHVLRGHTEWMRAVTWFPDGARLASVGTDGTLRVWDAAEGQALMTLPCEGSCWGLVVSPDAEHLVAATEKAWICIWDADTGAREREFSARMADCWTLAASPDGKRLASAGDDPLLRIWDAATGNRVASLPVVSEVRSVAFSPDGKLLAAGGQDGAVRFWDAATWRLVRSLEGHAAEVRDIAFSPDSRRLATASFDGTVRIWSIAPRAAEADAPAGR